MNFYILFDIIIKNVAETRDRMYFDTANAVTERKMLLIRPSDIISDRDGKITVCGDYFRKCIRAGAKKKISSLISVDGLERYEMMYQRGGCDIFEMRFKGDIFFSVAGIRDGRCLWFFPRCLTVNAYLDRQMLGRSNLAQIFFAAYDKLSSAEITTVPELFAFGALGLGVRSSEISLEGFIGFCEMSSIFMTEDNLFTVNGEIKKSAMLCDPKGAYTACGEALQLLSSGKTDSSYIDINGDELIVSTPERVIYRTKLKTCDGVKAKEPFSFLEAEIDASLCAVCVCELAYYGDIEE